MSRIPMTADVASVIGTYAEAVENRSLLLDKFVFHKKWGDEDVKWNEAARWSLLRIADGGAAVLKQEAKEKRKKANGQFVQAAKRQRLNHEAEFAEKLARTSVESADAQDLRTRHAAQLRELVIATYGEQGCCLVARLRSRLAINLSNSLNQNAGICLDRLFGLPYLPGSAVKGVARHAALHALHDAEPANRAEHLTRFIAIYGCVKNDFKQQGELAGLEKLLPEGRPMDQKGAVSFLPAYPLDEARVVVDLTNVHTPFYYQKGNSRDQFNENPIPNPFPAVEAGAAFSFPLVLNGLSNEQALLQGARADLLIALERDGIGAKTGAGYGWFTEDTTYEEQLQSAAAQQQVDITLQNRRRAERDAQEEQERKRQASMSPEQQAQEKLLNMDNQTFASFAKALADKTLAEQTAFLQLLQSNKEKRKKWKSWRTNKPHIADAIRAVQLALGGDPLP